METRSKSSPETEGIAGPFIPACRARIREWVGNGGPQVPDYPEMDKMIEGIYRRCLAGEMRPADLAYLQDAFGDAFSAETLQGFSFRKPHGYAGDFEIIDRIYSGYVCPSPHLANWDRYYQSQAAPRAVRNRKAYFVETLRRLTRPAGRMLEVLNLASGPGGDMRDLFLSPGAGEDVRFDCVEQDASAIAHAFRACREFRQRVRFIQANAFSYQPARQYDLVWSAGLFDYFSDAMFRRILKRLLPAIRPGGRLIIGNFSPVNPTRAYMFLFDWPLRYRTPGELRSLASACGIPDDRIRIEQEPLGVNLFMHILCP